MRGLAILGIVLGILIVSGAFTLASTGDTSNLIPFIQQSSNPSASTGEVEPWQAEQFFFLVGFLLINLIGMGMTIAGLLWFLSHGIITSRAEAQATESA